MARGITRRLAATGWSAEEGEVRGGAGRRDWGRGAQEALCVIVRIHHLPWVRQQTWNSLDLQLTAFASTYSGHFLVPLKPNSQSLTSNAALSLFLWKVQGGLQWCFLLQWKEEARKAVGAHYAKALPLAQCNRSQKLLWKHSVFAVWSFVIPAAKREHRPGFWHCQPSGTLMMSASESRAVQREPRPRLLI